MSTKSFLGVLLMTALLVLYLWAAAYQGYVMITTGQPVAIIMGVALIVLPLVGGWALFRELSFGFASAKLVKLLQAEGPLPGDDLDHTPSGKAVRAEAEKEFSTFASEAEHNPTSWQAWMKLGIAYDNSGDRKRARAAVRQAISLYKSS